MVGGQEWTIKYILIKKLIGNMKAYSDIEQSKKLAEILPIESADMNYWCGTQIRIGGYRTMDKDLDIPAWSLAALLEVIPKRIDDSNVLRMDIDDNDFAIWYDEMGGIVNFGVNDKLPDIALKEPVDACYEMILKLHELKML